MVCTSACRIVTDRLDTHIDFMMLRRLSFKYCILLITVVVAFENYLHNTVASFQDPAQLLQFSDVVRRVWERD